MQTFLPHADFRMSAAALDPRRLKRQREEALHILRIIRRGDRGPWSSHPAVAMWRGHEPALLDYALTMCNEWAKRRHISDALTAGVEPRDRYQVRQDAVHMELLSMVADYGPATSPKMPPWLGVEALHSNHRSRLKQKRADYYPGESASAEPAAPGNLWPVTVGHGRWVYMLEGKVVGTMGIVPDRRLRLGEARQCAYCNYWHNPEELDANGECATCASQLENRVLASELASSSDPDEQTVAEELFASIHDVIRLTRLGLIGDAQAA